MLEKQSCKVLAVFFHPLTDIEGVSGCNAISYFPLNIVRAWPFSFSLRPCSFSISSSCVILSLIADTCMAIRNVRYMPCFINELVENLIGLLLTRRERFKEQLDSFYEQKGAESAVQISCPDFALWWKVNLLFLSVRDLEERQLYPACPNLTDKWYYSVTSIS